jgi:hypothetical protein
VPGHQRLLTDGERQLFDDRYARYPHKLREQQLWADTPPKPQPMTTLVREAAAAVTLKGNEHIRHAIVVDVLEHEPRPDSFALLPPSPVSARP